MTFRETTKLTLALKLIYETKSPNKEELYQISLSSCYKRLIRSCVVLKPYIHVDKYSINCRYFSPRSPAVLTAPSAAVDLKSF